MDTRKVKNAAVTAGLCLTMTLGTLPTAAIAEAAQATNSDTAAAAQTADDNQGWNSIVISYVDFADKTTVVEQQTVSKQTGTTLDGFATTLPSSSKLKGYTFHSAVTTKGGVTNGSAESYTKVDGSFDGVTVYVDKTSTPEQPKPSENVSFKVKYVDTATYETLATKDVSAPAGTKLGDLSEWGYEGYTVKSAWLDGANVYDTDAIYAGMGTVTLYLTKVETPAPPEKTWKTTVTFHYVDKDSGKELTTKKQVFKEGDTFGSLIGDPGTPETSGYTYTGYSKSNNDKQVVASTKVQESDTDVTVYFEKNQEPAPQPWSTVVTFNYVDWDTKEVLGTKQQQFSKGDMFGFWLANPGFPETYGYKYRSAIDESGKWLGRTSLVQEWNTTVTVFLEKEEQPAPEPWTTTVTFHYIDKDSGKELATKQQIFGEGDTYGYFLANPGVPETFGYTYTGISRDNNDIQLGRTDKVQQSTTDVKVYLEKDEEPAPQPWTATVTFHYIDKATDKELASKQQTYNEGETFGTNIGNPGVPETFGYSYTGVSRDESDVQVTPNSKVQEWNTDVNVYLKKDAEEVQWAKATFLDDDGSTIGTADYQVNEPLNQWSVTPPAKDGYTFMGYAIQGKESDGVVDPKQVTMSVSGMTFVAVWQKDAEPVQWAKATFLDEDGSLIGTADYKVNEAMKIWAVTPAAKDGYTFKGYAIQGKESDGVVDPADVPMSVSGMTFVAVWEKNQEPTPGMYNVTFVDKFNGVSNVVEVKDGETVAKPSDPSFNGYVFAGWSTSGDSYVPYDFSTPVTDNITLYACYTPAEQTGDENVEPSTTVKQAETKQAAEKKALPQTSDATPVAAVAGVGVFGALIAAAGAFLKRRNN